MTRRRTRAEITREREEIKELIRSAFAKYRPGTLCTITDLYMAEPRLHDYHHVSITSCLSSMCEMHRSGGHIRSQWRLRE